MGPIIVTGVLFAAVFSMIGFALLVISRDLPKVGWYATVKNVGYLHLGLALLTMLAILVFSRGAISQAPCEIVPNTTTVNGSTMSFTWVSSCADVEQPVFFSYMTNVFIWIVGFEAIVLCLGAPFWILLRALRGGSP
jgi:hypothetical protein